MPRTSLSAPLVNTPKALLESAAEPSDGTDATGENGGGGDGPATKDRIRDLSEAAVDLAVQEMIAGGGASSGDKEEECVSEQAFRAEVDAAIYRLVADGTGRRDYANAAIGGKVVRQPNPQGRTHHTGQVRGDTCRAVRWEGEAPCSAHA